MSTLSAILLPILIGIAGLVVEYGQGLLTHIEDQRIADLAAFSGAIVYSSTSSTTSASSAVANIVALNGLASSTATPSLVTSPSGDGNQAYQVSVATSSPLRLTRVLSSNSTLPVNASSYAELKANAAACIIALSSSATGVTMSGGTSLSAPACAVASNATVTVPCGTYITTIAVDYDSSSAPSVGCGGITAPAGKSLHLIQTATADPLAGSSEVTTATSRLTTVKNMTSPTVSVSWSLPTSIPTGTAIVFNWNSLSGTLPSGCTSVWSSSPSANWTVTCAASTTAYNFGGLSVGGGITLTFNSSGSATNVYTFSGNLDLSSGSGFTFGPGTYEVQGNLNTSQATTFGAANFYVQGAVNITGSTTTFGAGNWYVGLGGLTTSGGDVVTFGAGNFTVDGAMTLNASGGATFGAGNFSIGQGLSTGGGTTTIFGAGTFTIGQSSTVCNYGSYKYSVCHAGSVLTFGGPSTFTFSSGIYNTGGETMTLGSGTTNSFVIGAGTDGNAFNAGGGAITTFADATGTNSVFQMNGNFNIGSGGGSCTKISAAAEHDINGYIVTAGGTQFGAGIYTTPDYVGLGLNSNYGSPQSSGGDVTCWGSALGVLAQNVTFVIGGANALTPSQDGGTAPSGSQNAAFAAAFYIGAGYSHVTITAPSTGVTADLAVIGPTLTSVTAGASFTEGASGTNISGVFYFPNGPIALSGAGSVTSTNQAGTTSLSGSANCLEMIGSYINVTEGSVLGTTCISSSATTSSVVLVQ